MLTTEEIDTIFAFCERHFVRQYDLQVELVDHLANAIEVRRIKEPDLNIDSALESIHSGFGVLGFASFVNSRAAALEKKYDTMQKRLFLSYFEWPKAALTACLLSILLLAGKILSGETLYYLMAAAFFAAWLFDMVVMSGAIRSIKKQKKHLMLTSVNYQRSSLGAFGNLILLLSVHFADTIGSNPFLQYGSYICMVIIVVLYFFSTVSYQKVIHNVQSLARQQYPEAFA